MKQKKAEGKRELITRFVKFGIVGGSGAIINTGILWSLTQMGLHYLAAAAIATEVAIITNFIGNHLFTFKDRKHGSLKKKFLMFQGVSIIGLICTLGVLWVLTTTFGQDPSWLLLVWNAVAIIISSVINFVLNHQFTWNNEVRA